MKLVEKWYLGDIAKIFFNAINQQQEGDRADWNNLAV